MSWKIWTPVALAIVAAALMLLANAEGDISLGGEAPGQEVQGTHK